MSRWFRFYDDAINDPKILRLSDAMFRAWATLLCIASKNDGILPPTKDIALVLRMKVTKAAEWLTVLTSAGLLDCDADGVFRPHNWDARQYKSDVTDPTAASRQRSYRERNKSRNGDRNVTVTVTDTRTDTEQITEQKEHCPDAKAPRTKYSEEFEIAFWQPYPRTPTMSKSEAWKAWQKLTPEQRAQSCQAIEPYRQHLRSKPTLETVHACRFLSQQRFEGFANGAAQSSVVNIRSSLV